jgi:uncharacterized protein YjiS (DUF1127 family)
MRIQSTTLLDRWLAGVRRSRRARAVAHLSDHMLRDIGLTRDHLRRISLSPYDGR